MKHLDRPDKSIRALLVIIGIAFLVHVAVLAPAFGDASKLFTWPDADRFERLAVNILAGNGYSVEACEPYSPNSTMVPGYPLFVAGAYAVFGRFPYAVVIVQIVLSLGLAAGIIFWVRRRLGLKIGLLAGIFLLLNLCLAFYSTQFMSDVLFLCFLAPALWFALRLFEDRSPLISGAAAGALLGLAALTRPIGLYFPLLLPFLFLVTRDKGRFPVRLAGYGLLAAAFVLAISPWFVRNKVTFGRIFFSTVQSFNLTHIHAAPVKASIEGLTVYEADAEFEAEAAQKYGPPANEAERYIFTGRAATRYLVSHPGRYAVLYAGGVAKTFLPLGFAEFLLFYSQGQPSIRNITPPVQKAALSGKPGEALRIIWTERIKPVGWWFVVYLLGGLLMGFLIVTSIIGFVKSKGFRRPFNLLAFLTALYFIGVTGPAGQPRHFLPALPVAAILAAYGTLARRESKTRRSVEAQA
ncbi:glycosyltransferase family 39 protein [candidate division WOR-3 bacterium]|nr:glycosyltransferase family 39 protein [candidate division WOR-3 bacterium]